MENSIPTKGKFFPRRSPRAVPASPLERLASFRFTYLAICACLVLYVFTVRGVEMLLELHFRTRINAAAGVDPSLGPLIPQLQSQVGEALKDSGWIGLGGVRVAAIVLAADGRTLFYTGGRSVIKPPALDAGGSELAGPVDEGLLLPATADIVVSLRHNTLLANTILVAYAGLLISILFVYTRTLTRREEERLEAVQNARDAIAHRAESIERELGTVRKRLDEVVPERETFAGEIRSLEEERAQLTQKLAALEEREAALRAGSPQSRALEDERSALEELLDEALQDLGQKDEEIDALQLQVKKAARAPKAPTRAREVDQLERRLRTLYKNIEIDDRAIQDLVGLRDDAMMLKAEEALKRLSDESDSSTVRRKVGGLPPHLTIFELGFAGKGRIYFTKGRQRRFRLLSVGAKNTQKGDLDYLSRLPRDT